MYLVTVFPDSDDAYVSQLYAGLLQLAFTGDIRLKYSSQNFGKDSDSQYFFATLLMKVTHVESNQCRVVFFDMADRRGLMMNELRDVDVYFKRSYDQGYVDSLAGSLRKKILPYGLHYACRSQHETPLMWLKRQRIYTSIHKTHLQSPSKALKQTLGRSIKMLLTESVLRKQVKNWPLFVEQFEVLPSEPAIPKIYFRTRVYDVSEAKSDYGASEFERVNSMRVGVIRALRSNFGQDFVGGLRYSPYAQRNYPDCMYPEAIDTAQHIENTKRYLININTDGLHGSVGWKFPEYLAASRCVVSEPIDVKLPVPIEDGIHYHSFSDQDECVRACEALFGDTQLAASMRKNSFNYYQENLIPSKLVYDRIKAAFSEQPSER